MGKLSSALQEKCPRCGKGDLFVNKSYLPFSKKPFQMMKFCPSCGLKYEKELGYFYGSMFVSYALNIALFVTSLVVYIFLFKENYGWSYFAGGYILLTLLLTGVIFRFSRSLWITVLTKYEPETKDLKNLETLQFEPNIGK
jgi:uncharacterized protein (DUF983 family)